MTLDVIYDGHCGFCVRAMSVCRALDVRRALRFHDANARPEIGRRFPELATADLDDAMFVVGPDRALYRGFFAFRRLSWASPLTWPLLPVFYFPGSAWLGPKMYAWVARHRRHFGCESDVCVIEPRSPNDD